MMSQLKFPYSIHVSRKIPISQSFPLAIINFCANTFFNCFLGRQIQIWYLKLAKTGGFLLFWAIFMAFYWFSTVAKFTAITRKFMHIWPYLIPNSNLAFKITLKMTTHMNQKQFDSSTRQHTWADAGIFRFYPGVGLYFLSDCIFRYFFNSLEYLRIQERT